MAPKRKSKAEPEIQAEDEAEVEEEEITDSLCSGDDEISRRQFIRKLLQPFGKDQLIEFLKDAATRNPFAIRKILNAAESDPVHRKIFVHGLGWDTTAEILADSFRQYGEIESCNVVMDKVTGKSKGFGFVLFRSRSGAQNALKQPQKKIGNRTSSCQLAGFGPVLESSSRKIYVVNLRPDLNLDRLRSFFEKFGEIEDVQLGRDQATGRPKGYAFFTYRTVEGFRKVLEEPKKNFEGCELYCKKALENSKAKPAASGVGSVLQPNDLALMYAPSSLMGLIGPNINPGLGVLHPVAAAGLSPSTFGAINGVNSSLIGGYSPAALQGSSQNPNLILGGDLRYVGSGLPTYLGR